MTNRSLLSFCERYVLSRRPMGQVPRKKVRRGAKVERKASLDILNLWQNALVCHSGMGLERFKEVEHPPEDFDIPFFCVTQDWHQVQWCPFWYLRNHARLYIEAVPDYTHVRCRNLEIATHFAGGRLAVDKAHMCNNVRSGPWQGAQWGARHGGRSALHFSQHEAKCLPPDSLLE